MTKKTKKIIGVGIGAIALYFLLKPKTTNAATTSQNVTTSNLTNKQTTPVTSGGSTGILADANSLINSLSSLFKGNKTTSAPSIISTTPTLPDYPTTWAPTLSTMPVITPSIPTDSFNWNNFNNFDNSSLDSSSFDSSSFDSFDF